MEEFGIVGASVAVSYGLIEVIKLMICKLLPKKPEGDGYYKRAGFSTSDRINLQEALNKVNLMEKTYEACDQNGIKMCYTPRKWGEHLEELVEVSKAGFNLMNSRLAGMEKSLDKIESRILKYSIKPGSDSPSRPF